MPDFIIYSPMNMNTTAPTIIGNDCLNIQEMFIYMSVYANCHNIAKRIIEAKARIIKPIQNRTCFSPLNNSNQPDTSKSIPNNRDFEFTIKIFLSKNEEYCKNIVVISPKWSKQPFQICRIVK